MNEVAKDHIESNRAAQLLTDLSLFACLPQAAIVHFAEKSRLLTHTKGKVLYIQGDEAEWFYVVVKGWVKLFRETLEGSEAVIDVLNDGQIFGEQAVVGGRYYNDSAELVDATQYIKLPISLLQYYLQKYPQLALDLLAKIVHKQQLQSHEIEHLNVQNAPQRIGCFLLRLCPEASEDSVSLNLPYDKTLIASKLGMKPETFSRALAKLKNDTKLEIRGAVITIPKLQILKEYTCHYCSQAISCIDEEPATSKDQVKAAPK